jgi:hypothetical protein
MRRLLVLSHVMPRDLVYKIRRIFYEVYVRDIHLISLFRGMERLLGLFSPFYGPYQVRTRYGE